MIHFFELTIHEDTWSKDQIIEILRHDGIVCDGVIYWGLHQDTKSHLVRLNTHKYSDFHNYEHTFTRYDLHRASKHRKEESKIELTDKNYFDKICTLTHKENVMLNEKTKLIAEIAESYNNYVDKTSISPDELEELIDALDRLIGVLPNCELQKLNIKAVIALRDMCLILNTEKEIK